MQSCIPCAPEATLKLEPSLNGCGAQEMFGYVINGDGRCTCEDKAENSEHLCELAGGPTQELNRAQDDA